MNDQQRLQNRSETHETRKQRGFFLQAIAKDPFVSLRKRAADNVDNTFLFVRVILQHRQQKTKRNESTKRLPSIAFRLRQSTADSWRR